MSVTAMRLRTAAGNFAVSHAFSNHFRQAPMRLPDTGSVW